MFGREEKVPQIRLTAIQYIILAIFVLLSFGLWRLQVIHQEKYDAQAQMNRIREVPILAPRGKILDREGRIIVNNYPSFSALLLRDQKQANIDADIDGIAAGLHLDPVELRQRLKRMMALPGFNPIFLKYDVTPDELAFIESHRNDIPNSTPSPSTADLSEKRFRRPPHRLRRRSQRRDAEPAAVPVL